MMITYLLSNNGEDKIKHTKSLRVKACSDYTAAITKSRCIQSDGCLTSLILTTVVDALYYGRYPAHGQN